MNRSCGEIVECRERGNLLVDKITYYFLDCDRRSLNFLPDDLRNWFLWLFSGGYERENIKISLQSNGLLFKRSVRFMVYSRLLCSILRMLWARTTKRNGEIVISRESLWLRRRIRRRFSSSLESEIGDFSSCSSTGIASCEANNERTVDSNQWFSLRLEHPRDLLMKRWFDGLRR